MRKILLFFLLVTNGCLFAQIGIRGGYGTSHFDTWQGYAYSRIDSKNASFLQNGWNVGVDYWFRLKSRRIEFMPEIGFSQFAPSNVDGVDYTLSSVNAIFNVHVYPLDLAEDCNCPTFSKQGNTIKKGFFIHVSPLLRYYLQNAKGIQEISSSTLVGGVRAGLGIDVGLSDFLTLSPMVAYEYTASANWKNLVAAKEQPIDNGDIASSHSGISGLVRLGFRFNAGRRRR